VYDLIVGDLLIVQVGDIMPIDGILASGTKILVDETQETGESDLVLKSPIDSEQ